MRDKHFNRAWVNGQHVYLDNTADRIPTTKQYSGWLKCKLLHGQAAPSALPQFRSGGLSDFYLAGRPGYLSLVVPDMVFLDAQPPVWIQPLHFLSNMLWKVSEEESCGVLRVDISCSQTLDIFFESKNFVLRYEDGSELYKCVIKGPPRLWEYASGAARWARTRPFIQLFHHTSEANRASILSSHLFIPTDWNIQGTKRLRNVKHVYLTCLPALDCGECLKTVAMATDGKLYFRRDPSPIPAIFLSKDLRPFASDVLALPVYRESTPNRRSTLSFWIDPGYLSPQHFLRHYDGRQIWYEYVSAFIYRLAVYPEATLRFSRDTMTFDHSSIRHFDYVVVGDAWRLDGLAAPFDEEETKAVFKVERPTGKSNILNFWFDHANSERFPVLRPTMMKFEGPSGNSGEFGGQSTAMKPLEYPVPGNLKPGPSSNASGFLRFSQGKPR